LGFRDFFDSGEYELLRELLLRLGHVECLSGSNVGSEAITWVLGHFDAHAPFYAALQPTQISNALPNAAALGTKDALYTLLQNLRDKVRPASFSWAAERGVCPWSTPTC
jgi:hypothetical protein